MTNMTTSQSLIHFQMLNHSNCMHTVKVQCFTGNWDMTRNLIRRDFSIQSINCQWIPQSCFLVFFWCILGVQENMFADARAFISWDESFLWQYATKERVCIPLYTQCNRSVLIFFILFILHFHVISFQYRDFSNASGPIACQTSTACVNRSVWTQSARKWRADCLSKGT